MSETLSFRHVRKEDMPRVAARITPLLGHGVVLLEGEMGAGKTTLVKYLVRELGSDDGVTSPTFALVNPYLLRNGQTVYHFDFYRIDDPREAFDMGYEEYFYGGSLCLVEWGEKVADLLPPDPARITLRKTPEGDRDIDFFAR